MRAHARGRDAARRGRRRRRRCRFGNLDPGTYALSVELSGFGTAAAALEVADGRAVHADISLVPAGFSEAVIVSATRVPTPVSALPNTVTIVERSVIDQRTASSDDLASVLEANVPGFGPSLKKLTGRGYMGRSGSTAETRRHVMMLLTARE